MINIYWIDLFCGAGGTSSGIHFSGKNVKVLACVNHDKNAIESHKLNHPDTHHFTEDIRDFAVVGKIKSLVDEIRLNDPNAIINLWASLECTNFSKAKGGLPRDADSRTLAEHMFMYLEAIVPNYFWIENVREFMSWGPLDNNGKPISKTNGNSFLKWKEKVCDYGYKVDHKILNAADFGAYQSRERLFMQFAMHEFPISWPDQTHTKKSSATDLFFLPKWKPVRDVLDLQDQGKSIFDRKKPLSENTLKRIYDGLVKFVSNGEEIFSQTYYGNGGTYSLNEPCPTITTKDRVAKVEVNFLDQQFSKSLPIGINRPCNALTTVPKYSIIKAKQFLFNPQYKSKGKSINEPCFTLIARQDKAPASIVSVVNGNYVITILENDSETMIKIKQFMVTHKITDILMRMLKISELLQIQGFPINYKLVGTQTEQKKYIGNAVEVNVAKALIANNLKTLTNLTFKLNEHRKTKI